MVVDLEPDEDPPKLLVVGPDRAGNVLEVIILEFAEERLLAIHAMPLRRSFFELLPSPEDPMPDHPKTYTTKTGRAVTDADIEAMADDAERVTMSRNSRGVGGGGRC